MAACVASPFSSMPHLQRGAVRARAYSNQPSFKTVNRNSSRNQCQLVRFAAWKMFEPNASVTTHCKISSRLQVTSFKCIGLGALVDLDGVAVSNLVPVVDQVLLLASIFLTYTAGIVNFGKPSTSYEKITSDKKVLSGSSDNYGSVVKENYKLESKYTFNAVRGKLLNSLNALEQKTYSGDIILHSTKQSLSLNAIAGAPKLRLLWGAFQKVEEEVKNISSTRSVAMEDNFFSEFIQRSCHSICDSWLEDEYSLLKGNFDKELSSVILEKVKQDNSIVQSITRSGKIDLYLELLQYLSFGSLREDCCYDSCIFGLHGISILEDLVIAIADGVASVYLEFISVDSDVSSKTNSLDMSLCALSTRELQKLRNEVALNQWLYHNMDTVVSMYEDRFDLCTLGSQRIDLPNISQTETQSWWRRLSQLNSKTVSPELQYLVINHFSMPVKRTKELRALAGWRYYFSLFLELSDISMPLIRAVIDKMSSAISFFLVTLIGRSLGLIYTGIRQSLRWK
ncbi:hypothetical protein HN51_054283 [Arachis hypogaea]|uniref:DUF3685 domain-containing protein n=1 Tax=Arachis hypogaea TaxID=3818 RepID=A0A6B9V9B0_ARAHY|nr:uncharacterized protein LOC107617277 [Arachis ipaensis]XP_016174498.1 uncharacterized protein LOC107617277 [Arachis ipaensis]XP_025676237.1 uncharacterized protein LOC112776329 [Arachis hypogaea]XP_025676238.1 uncharacterized protein LOC112776329 [Arachis hypogaea]QHN76812.1 uncharacterized protein DS421_19g647210 [Arachis hypogaea]